MIFSLVSTSIAVISLAISILTYKRYSRVSVKIRMPLVIGSEDRRETTAILSFASFPFSSLEDGIEHLKWVPVEIHNESSSKSISINLVWIEVFAYPSNEVFTRISSKTGLHKTKLLKVSVKERLPISVEANSYKTVHVSIKTVAEIWKEYIHRIGALKVGHSFGTATTDPFSLDLLWQYYSYVAHFVCEEILKREVDSLKQSKIEPDKLVDYVNSIYGQLGFVSHLGAVELSWILKEKEDPFFKPYLTRVEARLKKVGRQQEIAYQKAVRRGSIKPPKEGERIPVFILASAVPKNTESVLKLIEELENKTKHS